MIDIAIRDWNSQAIEAVLDRILFYLILNWNDEGEYWTLTIRNSAYRILVGKIAVASNFPLTWQFRYPYMPAGELWALSSKFGDEAIPRDGFQTGRWSLMYETEQELRDSGYLDVWGRTSGRVI